MPVIYETKGKAREYCKLALNIYNGCSHHCTYCYNTLYREDFYTARERPGLVDAIEKEAAKYKGEEVNLCFTCDPYQPLDVKLQNTRKALAILHRNGIRACILTKGGQRSLRDFDLFLDNKSKYGITLTSLSNSTCNEFESKAASPAERIDVLKYAKYLGIETYVSLEPVLRPADTLQIIDAIHEFVDEFRVGRWNYDERAKEIDWMRFTRQAVEKLEKLNCKYLIKNDLSGYLKK